MNNLGEYHDLYVQSDTLLLADVFANCWNMCLKIYELDATRFLTAPGLAWQAAFKKTTLKWDLLTEIDMSMVKNVLEEEYVTLFIDKEMLITNRWKTMIKIKSRHIFNIGMSIIYMVGQCCKIFQHSRK